MYIFRLMSQRHCFNDNSITVSLQNTTVAQFVIFWAHQPSKSEISNLNKIGTDGNFGKKFSQNA